MARVLAELGERREALEVLGKAVREFPESASLWILYAEELMQGQEWAALGRVAFQLREARGVRQFLQAYSLYLEARAEHGLHRYGAATRALEKMLEWEFQPENRVLEAASRLLDLGYERIARGLLAKMPSALHGEAAYWKLLFHVAEKLKDEELMVEASRRAYQLQAGDPINRNNYAAALLIRRQNPEEAVTLTFGLWAENPRHPTARINHAAALLLNRRVDEGATLLESVEPNRLTASEALLYDLDLFEAYCGLGQFERARGAGARVDAGRLYPTQRQWFERTLAELTRTDSRLGY